VEAPEDTTPLKIGRAAERLYASGGILEKLMRENYQEGLVKFQHKSFPNQEEKDQWIAWVKGLDKKERAIVRSKSWE
jgi:hypothetical protein